MAEIKIRRKKKGGAFNWLIILLLIIAALLILDATDTISTPDFFPREETIDDSEFNTY